MGLPVVLRAPATIAVGLSIAAGVFATLIGQHAINMFGGLFGLKTKDERMDAGSYWFRRVMAFCGVSLNPLWSVKIMRKFPFENAEALREGTNGGKVILMMNHLSNADPWLCSYAMNPFLSLKWVTKSANATLPIAGGCVRNSGDLLVHFVVKGKFDVHKGTTAPMLRQARQYLDRGMGLAVYPEAIRSLNPAGPLSEFKLGFFSMAIEAGAVIIPLALSGSEKAWPRGTWMFNAATVYMAWGDAVRPLEGETVEQLRDRVFNIITELREALPDRIATAATRARQLKEEAERKSTTEIEAAAAALAADLDADFA